MSQPTVMHPKLLLDGLAYVESPRWHEDRLWFAHWGTEEIVAVDLDGKSEVVDRGSPGLGWSIDWLPDGRLLVTGEELTRREPDGTIVRHADLSGLSRYGWNEIVVDGRGNIYVNSICFGFMAGEEPRPGIIALVTPDGDGSPGGRRDRVPQRDGGHTRQLDAHRVRVVRRPPHGVRHRRRGWALEPSGVGRGDRPDSITMDAEGAIWTHSADTRTHTGRAADPAGECVRVFEGGEIRERIVLDRAGFACTLGGPDRRTLFMLAAEWEGTGNVDEVIARRTGQVLVADAPAPGVGWP